MRVWCKKFARIPINTAGDIFNLIAGDLKGKAEAAQEKIRRKLQARARQREPSNNRANQTNIPAAPPDAPRVAAPAAALRYLPNPLASTLRALYHGRCRQHDKACLTTTHLREQHGTDIRIPALLLRCQDKNERLTAKHDLLRTKKLC